MAFQAGVDVDWCLTCGRHHDTGKGYCSPQCEPSHSWQRCDDSDDSDDEAVMYHAVEDTSSAKGIAEWAANVPAGASPNHISSTPSYSSSQPKLLRPQSSRPVPPALSMSESTTTSIPLSTPPSISRNHSVLSSLANHVKSFVSCSSAGFSVRKSRPRPTHNLSSTIHHLQRRDFGSSVSDEDEHDCGPAIFSPTDSPYDEMEDMWWVTESDYSAQSSPVTKKSSAQLIVGSSAIRRNELECQSYFQPKVLPVPVELSSRLSKLEFDDDDAEADDERAWRARGRQAR